MILDEGAVQPGGPDVRAEPVGSGGRAGSEIRVTKTFLPPLAEFERYVRQIWACGQVTNQGPMLEEFEERVAGYLGVPRVHYVSSGTTALQLALNALGITGGEVITTPFSYVATTTAILWERCTPVFVDIDPDTLCLDPAKIEAAITNATRAILPVHIFGRPCDVAAIGEIARRHDLPVIYDGAHAFGVQQNGGSLLRHGDVSICSFHATKLFHTVEGGAVITSDPALNARIELTKRFGHDGDEHVCLGINAKASEFHAAMGLCNLPYVERIIEARRRRCARYDELISEALRPSPLLPGTRPNHAFYPVLLRDEARLHHTMKALQEQDVFPRRYFSPALNTLPYLRDRYTCPVAEHVASVVVCLPLSDGLDLADVERIGRTVNEINR